MNSKRKPLLFSITIFICGAVGSIYLSSAMHQILTTKSVNIDTQSFPVMVSSIMSNPKHRNLYLCLLGLIALLSLYSFLVSLKTYKTKVITVTPRIKTPAPAGQGQHGNARWQTEREIKRAYSGGKIKIKDDLIKYLTEHGYDDVLSLKNKKTKNKEITKYEGEAKYLSKGGIVLGKKKTFKGEKLYIVDNDTHTLCIGATRSGKSRTVVLQSICTSALAEENVVVTDPKGELYQYTYPLLQRLGYDIKVIDFKDPLKSDKYNFLQPIIEAVDENNIPKALDAVWNLTASLVGEPKGEKIWANGEAAVIAASALAVVFDNREPDKRKYQNMCNVYHFLANMCLMDGDELLMSRYFKDLPEDHPSRPLMAIAEVAPPRTRGSFFTSALTTLRLFTSPYIADMTNETSIDLKSIADKKTALFIILPDDKLTYYSLAALLVNQLYEQLVTVADNRGGRLKRRVNFMLDEFGNFTAIPNFDNKLTVGGGRGIRFNIFVQDFAQIDDKYNKDVAKTVKGNCQTWIYLQTDEIDTLKQISEKLGNYTTSSYSITQKSSSVNTSDSQSVNLIARPLLTPEEVYNISRPYSLVTSRNHPVIMYSPDLSQWLFNMMLGLGDEEFNRQVRELRQSRRIAREVTSASGTELWGIWNVYNS